VRARCLHDFLEAHYTGTGDRRGAATAAKDRTNSCGTPIPTASRSNRRRRGTGTGTTNGGGGCVLDVSEEMAYSFCSVAYLLIEWTVPHVPPPISHRNGGDGGDDNGAADRGGEPFLRREGDTSMAQSSYIGLVRFVLLASGMVSTTSSLYYHMCTPPPAPPAASSDAAAATAAANIPFRNDGTTVRRLLPFFSRVFER